MLSDQGIIKWMETFKISWHVAYCEGHWEFRTPNNVDTAPNENILIGFSKKPGKRVHKKEMFVSQVSNRLWETDLICKAYHALARRLDPHVEYDDLDMLDSEQSIANDVVDALEIIELELVGKPYFICIWMR